MNTNYSNKTTTQNESIESAEQELQLAVDSGDSTAIIQSRSRLNALRMEQFSQQAALLREQRVQQQLEKEQAEKELVVDDYIEYLKTGSLSSDKLERLIAFDKKRTDFEKIDFRLEAIERIKLEYPGPSFNSYQAILESVHTDYDSLDHLLNAEYSQISKNISVRDKQATSEQSMDRILE